MSADGALRDLAREWLTHHNLPGIADRPAVWAAAGLRFGWNRHSNTGPFQNAIPTLLPGSIFALSERCSAEQLEKAIGKGFFANPTQPDSSKRRGFGCLAVHPGKAASFYEPSVRRRKLSGGELAQTMNIVYEMKATPYLPTPSQIRAIEQRLVVSTDEVVRTKSVQNAMQHLQDQCRRTPEIFHVWEPIVDQLEALLLNHDTRFSKPALKALADISQTRRNKVTQTTGDRQ